MVDKTIFLLWFYTVLRATVLVYLTAARTICISDDSSTYMSVDKNLFCRQ